MSRLNKKNQIIVILGPTSSGKTGLAVDLAHKYNGEIVSADSRQVYTGMDVGTGKDLPNYKLPARLASESVAGRQITNYKTKKKEVIQIKYHLIDVVKPTENFDLAKYQKLAFEAIDDILSRGKLPIIAGGSGLYLQAIVDGYKLSKIGENKKLRKELEKLNVENLYKKLLKFNKKFALKLNNSERNNKRRLIRYIEIQQESKKAIKQESNNFKNRYDFLIFGLNWPRKILCERIYQRIIARLEKEDMVGEVKRLHRNGVSWKRLEGFGLEYKFISLYLQKKLTYDEMVEKLNIASRQFAKRQMSWFRRWERQGRKIFWIKNIKDATKLIKKD